MGAPLGITRMDYTSGELRHLSGRISGGAQVRRMLALPMALEGRLAKAQFALMFGERFSKAIA